MVKINKTFSLSIISTSLFFAINANATSLYLDQISFDSQGQGVCSNQNYRAITKEEAEKYHDHFMKLMGRYQYTSLADGWIIYGEGYAGEIKKGYSYSTWCYPQNDDKTPIPELEKIILPEGDELDIQESLVSDKSNFIKPISYLSHNLGYAWVGGNKHPYIGEDMDIKLEDNKWILQGNNEGSCSGYRCNEKTKIIVSNFGYTLNPGDFWNGDITVSDKELVGTVTGIARNNTDTPQQVVIDLSATESTSWSKTNNYGFSESVSTNKSFNWPIVGGFGISVSFEANQSFGETNSGSSSKTMTFQARPTIPPHSEVPVKVDLYKASISYPYKMGVNLSYDITMDGFLRWSGNAWHGKPTNRPYINHTFTIGRTSPESNDIRYQWDHRNIEGTKKWWDWSEAIEANGIDSMLDATSKVLRPYSAYVSGNFYAESQFAGTIDIGEAVPISTENKQIDNSKVELLIDKESVKPTDLGFKNFDLKLSGNPSKL